VDSDSVTSGQNASFSVATTGASTSYQWEISANGGTTWADTSDGASFAGSGTSTLTVEDPPASMSGDEFRAQLTNAAGSSVSAAGTLTVAGSISSGGPTGSARIINLSIRSFVGSGADLLTVGFAIGGSGSKELLIRAVGPTLAAFGVSGVLASPQLTLFNSSSVSIDSDAGWGASAQLADVFASVGAFALPANSADSALSLSLSGGTTYTAEISGLNGTSGVALAEVYDADGAIHRRGSSMCPPAPSREQEAMS